MVKANAEEEKQIAATDIEASIVDSLTVHR
jgi:hypothetical protein